MGQSPHFEFEGPGSERIDRLSESMDRASGAPANESPDAGDPSGGNFQAPLNANRAGKVSSIADDELVVNVSDELMKRKEELYRRLAR